MTEVLPLLQPVAGIDLQQYRDELVHRFSNPYIGDRLSRLAGRGSTKLVSYVVPSIAEARRSGAGSRLLVMAVAGWIALLTRSEADGDLAVQDPMRHELAPLAARGRVRPLLAQVRGFEAIAQDDEVCSEIERTVAAIDRDGARAVLRAAMATR